MALRKEDIQKFLDETSNDIFNTLRLSAQLHSMEFGAQEDALPNRLTLRTGATLRALMGTGSRDRASSIAMSEATPDGIRLTYGVRLPWAALQEIGGIRVVTEGMRRFYWAKYFQATDPDSKNKWKRLALFKKTVRYPARPFLFPTVENPDTQNKIAEQVYDLLGDVIQFNYELMITGAKNAERL